MKTQLQILRALWIFIILSFIIKHNEAYASHAQGADLTYQCLGGNQYKINVSFYRDCGGVNAPNTVTVNAQSASCNQNINYTLTKVPGTGIDITQTCNQIQTNCSGGMYPGVQEWVYTTTITLPAQCNDWVFSFTLCCRNNVINTIQNPGTENIYVEAKLNNLDFACNNSPTFSNPPVSFPCVLQTFCYNHGANDVDNDSLAYSLIAPKTGANTTVTYVVPYTPQQPLASNPPVTFNSQNGDICMTPSMMQVTVVAVLVEEYQDGIFKGSVMRDMQIKTINCSNTLPYITGINGTNVFNTSVCAQSNLTFTIQGFDPDPGQNITLTWNNGIPGASFVVNNNMATFSWTPGINDISNIPHCFTVTVKDDACPYNGLQTYSFCITVNGFTISIATTNSNCGASNGTATVTVNGGQAPFTYTWSQNGGNGNQHNGLPPGNHWVSVTDNSGCTITQNFTINNNGAPGNINITSTNVSCFGGANGSATANVNGGQPPYTYLWSNGMTTQGINGLTAGTYWVQVTTNQGCVKYDTIIINQPAPLLASLSVINVQCFGGNNGMATAFPIGGTAPYNYLWNTVPVQITQTATGLSAGTYTVTITDANGCMVQYNVSVMNPSPVSISTSSLAVSCHGGSNGMAIAIPSGGNAPYSFMWNTNPIQYTDTAFGLVAGTYTVTVVDMTGCTNTASVTVTEPTSLLANINFYKGVSCNGLNDGSVTIGASGGVGPYTVVWNTIPAQYGYTLNNAFAGNYTATITDANGCVLNYNVIINQPAPVFANITNTIHVICFGQNNGGATVAGAGGVAPYTYSWSTVPVQTTATAVNLQAGNYFASVIDANGCIGQTSVLINQPAVITTSLQTTNPVICPHQTTDLIANATGGVGNYVFVWSNGLGVGGVKTVSPSQHTTYSVQAYDGNNCPGTIASITITVNNIDSITLVVNGTTPVCEGEEVSVWANVLDGIGNYQYQWNNGLGTGAGPHIIKPQQSTYYKVVVTDICGNTKADSVYITVNPLPMVDILPQSSKGCGEAGFLCYNSGNNPSGYLYQWNFGDGNFSSQASPIYAYKNSGTYTVILTVTTPFGCKKSDTTQFVAIVFPQSVANFEATPDEVSVFEGSIRFKNLSEEADTWLWSFGDNESSNIENPIHLYKEKGVYAVTLYVNNKWNCPSEITKEVTILPEFTFYIPNAFTPDGDGKNEVFNGKGEEILEYSMYVFDRWGHVIFETNSLEAGWDGTVKGNMVPVGTYVYLVKLKDYRGKEHHYDGHVSVIR
ncbi:MAG: T9SS type B sorting domain-containing protein [Bacteroidetes bacterium]|nr:PKD domain-containing protein [Bacteroidota bacterium]MBV6461815.1 hypothetical protein [Flavobacteriales bacterium]MCL4816691.1 gliding motility-associated C-terminal domain-containing protein [Flavobacteriales bacterium]NOG95607.1 T9SS type B sorting domain-containing protein [Bacteroidota bacterium]CAG0971848.1 Collagenase ColH [Flavobacteriales bacterium]